MISRRTFLASTFAASGLASVATRAVAQLAAGTGTLYSVSDGYLQLPIDRLVSGLPEEAPGILSRYGVAGDDYRSPCNVSLLRSGDRTVLFDAGSGSGFLPTAGDLAVSLEAIGVTTSDVTDVVFTHGHPDHLWGVLDDFDDPTFPNANLYIGRMEWNYWTNPKTVEELDASLTSFAVGASRRLSLLQDRIEFFDDGDEILPGVLAVGTPGHTVGHVSFLIGTDTNPVFIVGDALTNAHLSLEHPGWRMTNDHDPDMAAETRIKLIDMLAAEQTPLIGFHLPNGGMGRIDRASAGYRFVGLDQ